MKINMSIDDVSPKPESDTTCFRECYRILDEFPDAKFTLFIPTALQRFGDGDEFPYLITNYPEFIETIRSLPPSNFEIGMHGHFHGRIIPDVSNNGEFEFLNYQQALEKYHLSKKIFNDAKIEVKPVFRPSAFRMSPVSFDAAKDFGIQMLALAKWEPFKSIYRGKDEEFATVNYVDFDPPLHDLSIDYCRNAECIEIMYHALKKNRNYLNEKNADRLIEFLKSLNNPEFVFMGDLFYQIKSK
jgi:hypothetical protein